MYQKLVVLKIGTKYQATLSKEKMFFRKFLLNGIRIEIQNL